MPIFINYKKDTETQYDNLIILIKNTLVNKGISQRDLASRVGGSGIDPAQISRYLKKQLIMDTKMTFEICSILELTTDDLRSIF